jgi:hypothetical protein
VSPVRYELGFYIPEDDILHSDRREHLRSYKSENQQQLHVHGQSDTESEIRIYFGPPQALPDRSRVVIC